MTYIKDNLYRDIPFSSETPQGEFYTYYNIRQLAAKCEESKEDNFKCRTIGILQSIHGRFHLSDIDTTNKSKSPLIQISVVYLKSPLQSTVIPYPVQVFGTVQWKKRPVLFAKLLQVMPTTIAVMLNKAMDRVTSIHLARSSIYDNDSEDVT